MNGTAHELDLGLVGRTLEAVEFGYTVDLVFSGDRDVLAENVIRLRGTRGPLDVQPGEERSPALDPLIGQTVTAAAVVDPGELRLSFADGTDLQVPPNPQYESWTVTGPDGLRVVSLARGKLAVWGVPGYGGDQRSSRPARPVPAPPRSGVVYYGSLPPGHDRDHPGGVVRRTHGAGFPVDEVFTRNLRWEPTTALRLYEMGRSDYDYVEITEAEAEAFVDRVTRALG